MKKFILLCLAAMVAFSACSTTRRVSSRGAGDSDRSWVGSNTTEILQAMGEPSRIDTDGRGGSILIYESTPDYDSPDYDILDPNASTRTRKYANFYLDAEGRCYRVDSNIDLPAAQVYYADDPDGGFLETVFDILLIFPLAIGIGIFF